MANQSTAAIKRGKMEYDESDVGVNLLESITLGLYRYPLNAIREYIQNEMDSDPKPKEIDVTISGHDAFVIGNGSGMSWNDVLKAKKVGISGKDPNIDAGFRGIGIFSGIAVCREVVIETRKKSSNERIVLRMNAEGLRKEILERSNRPLLKALSDHVSWEIYPCTEQDRDHGTTVHLREILPEHHILLDKGKVKEYLELTAPADLSPEFAYKKDVNEFLDKHVPEYRTFKITLNGQEIFRRPFLGKDKLSDPHEYVFRKGSKVRAAWWVSPTARKQIELPANRNFVYKCRGISVGGRDALNPLIDTNKNLLDWMVGEIHVVDPEIKPNTERVAFEPSKARDELEHWIKTLWTKDVKEIPRRISAEIVTQKRLARSDELIAQSMDSINNDDDWMNALRELKDLEEDLSRDSKDSHLSTSLRTKANDRWKKISSRYEKAMATYNNWKRKQLGPGKSQAPSSTTELERETGGDGGFLTKPSGFGERPNRELLEKIDPLIEGLVSRMELSRPQALVVSSAVAALSTITAADYDFFRTFLAKLEEFLREE